jgi:hypothetical protein
LVAFITNFLNLLNGSVFVSANSHEKLSSYQSLIIKNVVISLLSFLLLSSLFMPIESIQNISDPVFASSSEIWRLNSIEEVNSSYAGYDLTVTGSKVEWKYTSEEPGVETQYSNFILPDMPTELIPGQEFIIQLNAETGKWTDDRKWFSSAPKDEWYNSSYYTRMSIEAYFASQEINEDVRAWWLQKNTLVDDEYHTTEYSGENKLKPYS